jgi:hypothetical protein
MPIDVTMLSSGVALTGDATPADQNPPELNALLVAADAVVQHSLAHDPPVVNASTETNCYQRFLNKFCTKKVQASIH